MSYFSINLPACNIKYVYQIKLNIDLSICFLGEDVVSTCSRRLSNPQDVQENETCKLKNKKGKVLKEDKRGKSKKVEKTKSKVGNSTTFAPSYNLLQILSNEPTCSKYWDDEDVCSSGAETISIRALSVGSLFECEESRSGYVDIDSVKPGEQVSHVPSTYVADGSGKKGFPPPKDKVKGKANK